MLLMSFICSNAGQEAQVRRQHITEERSVPQQTAMTNNPARHPTEMMTCNAGSTRRKCWRGLYGVSITTYEWGPNAEEELLQHRTEDLIFVLAHHCTEQQLEGLRAKCAKEGYKA